MRLRKKRENLRDVPAEVGGDPVDDLQRGVLFAAFDLADAAPADIEISGHAVLADSETGPELINVVAINQISHSTAFFRKTDSRLRPGARTFRTGGKTTCMAVIYQTYVRFSRGKREL